MGLSRLIYVSHKPDNVSANAIQDILDRAPAENKKLNITGILLFQ